MNTVSLGGTMPRLMGILTGIALVIWVIGSARARKSRDGFSAGLIVVVLIHLGDVD